MELLAGEPDYVVEHVGHLSLVLEVEVVQHFVA